MSDLLGSSPARARPQPDQARTLEMLATLFLVAFVVAMLYVGREIFIPIAIAILVSFVLSPPAWVRLSASFRSDYPLEQRAQSRVPSHALNF